MRKIIVILTIIVLISGMVGCRNTTDNPQVSENSDTDTTLDTDVDSSADTDSNTDDNTDTNTVMDSSRVLIAYFSVPEDDDTTGVDAIAGASEVVDGEEIAGNTQFVAQIIQQTIGGDLLEIVPVDPYPLDHDTLVDQAAEEQDENFRPELATHIENPDRYTTILLGFPNWWGDMPMAMYSFLEEYDFGSKTIIPFITHGGSGASDTLNTIFRLQPRAAIQDNALVLSRNDVATSEADVVAWANALEIK